MTVYYVSAPALGLVKIGYAADAVVRFSKIQSDCPVALTLLATEDGDVNAESARHIQFGHLRSRGEWFRMATELQSHIDLLGPFAAEKKLKTLTRQIAEVGVSQSYASMIATGKRRPPRPLAIHIFRTTGWRHSTIADLTDEQIAMLESIEPWVPASERAA